MTFRTSEFQRGAECSVNKYGPYHFYFFKINLLNINFTVLFFLSLVLFKADREGEKKRKKKEEREEEKWRGKREGKGRKEKGREMQFF